MLHTSVRVVDEDNQAAQCGNLFFDPYQWCVDAGQPAPISFAEQDLWFGGLRRLGSAMFAR